MSGERKVPETLFCWTPKSVLAKRRGISVLISVQFSVLWDLEAQRPHTAPTAVRNTRKKILVLLGSLYAGDRERPNLLRNALSYAIANSAG